MLFDRPPSSPETGRPCWYCQHYAGPAWGDSTLALCAIDPKDLRCKAQASIGCAFFARAPGVDDDDWTPPAPVLKPLRKPDR